jgi:hypothetical protein
VKSGSPKLDADMWVSESILFTLYNAYNRPCKHEVPKLPGERIARQVTMRVAEIIASYIKPPSDKGLGESLGQCYGK